MFLRFNHFQGQKANLSRTHSFNFLRFNHRKQPWLAGICLAVFHGVTYICTNRVFILDYVLFTISNFIPLIWFLLSKLKKLECMTAIIQWQNSMAHLKETSDHTFMLNISLSNSWFPANRNIPNTSRKHWLILYMYRGGESSDAVPYLYIIEKLCCPSTVSQNAQNNKIRRIFNNMRYDCVNKDCVEWLRWQSHMYPSPCYIKTLCVLSQYEIT